MQLPTPPRVVLFVSAMVIALTPLSASAKEDGSFRHGEFIDISEWQIEDGDRFVADTKSNIGYLVHENGGYTSFLIASGQKRVVTYNGNTYNAETPEKDWTVFSEDIKGDHTTFGERGRFLRLYTDVSFTRGDVLPTVEGKKGTPYGIHTHRSIAEMLSKDLRFRSMGCILVADDILDIIEATFKQNNNRLNVSTVRGLPEMSPTFTEEKPLMWW